MSAGKRADERAPEGALGAFVAIRREEWPLALALLAYFFLTITTFWILKPIKKGLFIGFYKANGIDLLGAHLTAAQAELVAKIANMGVAFVAAIAFTLLSQRYRREKLTYVFSGFFLVVFAFYAWAIAHPSGIEVWTFYLLGDLYSSLMVATFFACANDSVDSDAAKRLYGIVGVGGVAGGAFGSSIVSAAIGSLGTPSWLLVCMGITVLIVVLAAYAGKLVERRHHLGEAAPKQPLTEAAPEGDKRAAALEGARLVLRSRYLLAIVAIVVLYEMVSTIMDFQFTSSVQKALDASAIPGHFAKVFAITNWVALGVQIFFTSFVLRRFGMTVALLVLPVSAALGSAAFLVAPVLLVGSALNTADNAFSYSINQSAKEVLYVPTTRDEKYKAKAFIDMFAQRTAKAVAVVVSLGISSFVSSFTGVRLLSIVTLAILGVWGFAAVSAGRRFHDLEEREAPAGERARPPLGG
jgi:AAA family ATP:ADP antiporter